MEIRIMKIGDYEEVHQLWASTAGMGMRSLDDSKEGIEKFLKRNPNSNFVAIKNGKIVGVILSGHDGRRGYIYHTAVSNSYRKNGIGKALVNAVIKSMQEEGINKIALVAFSNNILGNSFWESIGFGQRTDLTYRNISINNDNK